MPRVLIFYHYFHPDNVVSAQHLTELGEELRARGWEVMAMPCNRGCRDETQKFKPFENWNGIEIRRIWRPCFRQSSKFGRVFNALWMIFAWSIAAFKRRTIPNIDVLIMGTDPILSVSVAYVWKLIRPRTKVVHWCFDLYPEAAIAEGILNADSFFVRVLTRLLKTVYRACDIIIDIGSCMRAKLRSYGGSASCVTLTPWALVEPTDALSTDFSERKKVFGDVGLAILYSGNFGRAHCYDLFLDLARDLCQKDIKFAFSIRGNCADKVKKAVTDNDRNIIFAPFAPIEQLQARLSAADIHLVSLKPEWTGTVVPSKFFGSLAAGRPIIFYGSSESAIAKWIEVYKVGWVLTKETMDSVVRELARLSNFPQELAELQAHSHQIYQEIFSKKHISDLWDKELRTALQR
jgi:hypothetical protein